MSAMSPMPLTESYWPSTGAESPRRDTIATLLSAAVDRRPDGVALVEGVADPALRRRWTYRELQHRTRQVATALLQSFDPGDRVALWAPNSADWVCFQLGAGMAGIVLVTVNPAYQHAELAHVLHRSEVSGLYFAAEHRGRDLQHIARQVATTVPSIHTMGRLDELIERAEQVEPGAALPDVTPDDIAQIQYTSGTTGSPKGAMLTHGGISTAFDQVTLRAGFTDDAPPTWINPMPLFHIGGAGLATVGVLARAGTHVIMPGFDVELFLELAEVEQGTLTLAVPTMLIAILEHPSLAGRDLSSLRTVLTGGSTVPTELVLRVQRELDARVLITFGQTECHGTMSMTQLDDTPEDISATVGIPFDHVDVKIADPETGATVAIGAPGEILVRGQQVMAGYYNEPAATAAAIDDDGWLRFGDLGTMDQRGYLRVIGRLKDMVIRGGENIYPREIEDVLSHHPDVGDVAVVGVPDATWGEEVAAVVRFAADITEAPDPEALLAYCRERLAGYKCPRLWFYVTELPLTPSGKVIKHRLASMIAEGELRATATFTRQISRATRPV
jgi:acyl-CoA synthetase (AMP-forming)/AMP-acid ligase II